MKQSSLRRVTQVFARAVELEEPQRGEYVRRACHGDAALRSEAMSLLEHQERAWNFMGVHTSVGGKFISHYKIEKRIAEGGMGIVYKAYDTCLIRPVAIKVLPPWALNHPDFREQLLTEARCASALAHPNVVVVHDFGKSHGVEFLVMEYISGKGLDRHIPEAGLPVREAVFFALQVGEALRATHAAGILHRDIKAANVMVTAGRRVKIVDFGLAVPLALGQPSRPWDQFGTTACSAPEQLLGRSIDVRSDIFSFGVLLYHMLHGRQPFRGKSAADVSKAIFAGHRSELPLHVPGWLKQVVESCLQTDLARRFRSMTPVLLALRANSGPS